MLHALPDEPPVVLVDLVSVESLDEFADSLPEAPLTQICDLLERDLLPRDEDVDNRLAGYAEYIADNVADLYVSHLFRDPSRGGTCSTPFRGPKDSRNNQNIRHGRTWRLLSCAMKYCKTNPRIPRQSRKSFPQNPPLSCS